MTLPLLKILSHRIASESWPELNKQCFWTAFTVAFYGSFRFSELVSQSGKNYNSKETLLWSDIQFGKDFVVIHKKQKQKIQRENTLTSSFKRTMYTAQSKHCLD
jgi:hypothetical protein